ncbi:DUF58 domain-containing protein [Thiocystis violascens]|uniref:DUF58 domain-containing protein n=1 Tax=Thiocystis violascens (strain ATCC 17096 / DSM 198 / 6111) TaxID=765911 RepID=I3Y5L4_THIV6|nr:DUF58 domain-containing protein [Thiocystis violascens]AFL72282.1 hypothetical protein Thivi_0212 [Thiocystis violascens DSM 198]
MTTVTPRQTDATAGIRPDLKELIALRGQARRLDLAPRGRVLATRSGGHLSRFRGRGMEFDESRVYQPGDDPRNMDWRVTARAGTPHVKLFREERERPVWLLVDQGMSMRFGTRVAFKSVIAAQAAALLGWAAVDRGDRVGGLVFDETRYLERRPAARGAGLLPLLDRLTAPLSTAPGEPGGVGHSSIVAAAEHLTRLIRPGSLVAVISDFADIRIDHSGWLAQLGAGSELLLILVHDAIESEVPPPGRYPVADGARQASLAEARTGILDLTSARLRDAYLGHFQRRWEILQRLARRDRAHLLRLTTHEPVGPALARGLGARSGAGMAGGSR